MHSEYKINALSDLKNFLLLSVKNSDYHRLSAVLLLCNFMEFVKYYYSNDGYFGLVDKYLILSAEEHIKFDKKEDLKFINKMHLQQISYVNMSEKAHKNYEKINYGTGEPIKSSKYKVKETDIFILETDINKIELLIEKYYGDDFFIQDAEVQDNLIFCMLKYIHAPAGYVSEWIMHFYLNIIAVIHRTSLDSYFNGFFAADSALIVLESYLVSYRLQNKAFKEIDFNLVNSCDYKYTEVSPYDMFEHFKQIYIDKGIVYSEDEFSKRFLCEIYRNAFAHGNLSFGIERNSTGEIVHNMVLLDEYKGKQRIITISLDEAKKFLESKAFSRGKVELI